MQSLLLIIVLILNFDNRNFERSRPKGKSAQNRIVGGVLAKSGQAPFQVCVFDRTNAERYCGGSLIGRKTVLTAAHCCDFMHLNNSSVKYDGFDRTKLKTTNKITKVIMYPGWTLESNVADFCILRLKDQVRSSPTVKFIKLARHEPATGDKVKTMGWGLTKAKAKGGQKSIHLKYIEMKILPRDKCHAKMQSYFKMQNSTPGYPVTSMMICGEAEGGSACHYDSGSPLVSGGVQVGIASFSTIECFTSYPTVFANIAPAYSWIKANTV